MTSRFAFVLLMSALVQCNVVIVQKISFSGFMVTFSVLSLTKYYLCYCTEIYNGMKRVKRFIKGFVLFPGSKIDKNKETNIYMFYCV